MGAFDTLQKIYRKWPDRWVSIWIVCEDEYADVTPSTPVQIALKRIEDHGGAVGIVGLTILGRTFTFLKKPLRAGKDAVKLLDKCGDKAADRFLTIAEAFAKATKDKN